jgi:hypothetical protein
MEEIIKEYKGTRQTPIRSIRNQFRKFRYTRKLRSKSGVTEPKGSSSGGSSNNNIKYYDYLVTTDIYNKYNNHYKRYSKYKHFTMNFSKPKLVGSIVTIGNTRARIISNY